MKKLILFLIVMSMLISIANAESVTRYFETNVTLIDTPWDELVNTSCANTTYSITHHNLTIKTEDVEWYAYNLDNTSKNNLYRIRLARTFDTNYTNATSELLAIKAISYFGECGAFTCKEAQQNCESEKSSIRATLLDCQNLTRDINETLNRYTLCQNDLSTIRNQNNAKITQAECDLQIKAIKDSSNLKYGIAFVLGIIASWIWAKWSKRGTMRKTEEERAYGSREIPENTKDLDKEIADKIEQREKMVR